MRQPESPPARSASAKRPRHADEPPERYAFSWAGKRQAIAELASPPSLRFITSDGADAAHLLRANLFIEGDNLEALKLLRGTYAGRVRMIYIDPPYNTGGDFVYADDYPDHASWLSMMYPRLAAGRELLRDDGVIFVSIDDHEVHHLRLLMNEIFGEESFLATFVWKRRSGAMDAVSRVSSDHEYVLCYGRGLGRLSGEPRTFARYGNPDGDPRGPWIADNLSAAKPGGETHYAITDPATGCSYWPPSGRYWPYSPRTMARKIAEGRIVFPRTAGGSPLLKRFKSEARSMFRPVSTWIAPAAPSSHAGNGVAVLTSSINTEGTRQIKELFGDKVFSHPKPLSLIRSLLRQGAPEAGDIVLDFFAGSCTTAHAVMEQNIEDGLGRQFIMVQRPEPLEKPIHAGDATLRTIADIGRERIRRAAMLLRKRHPPESSCNVNESDLESAALRIG